MSLSLTTCALLALVALLSQTAGCGFRSGDKGLYDPCTRDYECRDPLICRTGACAEPGRDAMAPDGGTDASTVDASTVDASTVDASTVDASATDAATLRDASAG